MKDYKGLRSAGCINSPISYGTARAKPVGTGSTTCDLDRGYMGMTGPVLSGTLRPLSGRRKGPDPPSPHFLRTSLLGPPPPPGRGSDPHPARSRGRVARHGCYRTTSSSALPYAGPLDPPPPRPGPVRRRKMDRSIERKGPFAAAGVVDNGPRARPSCRPLYRTISGDPSGTTQVRPRPVPLPPFQEGTAGAPDAVVLFLRLPRPVEVV